MKRILILFHLFQVERLKQAEHRHRIRLSAKHLNQLTLARPAAYFGFVIVPQWNTVYRLSSTVPLADQYQVVSGRREKKPRIHTRGFLFNCKQSLIVLKIQHLIEDRAEDVQRTVIVRTIFIAAVIAVLVAALENPAGSSIDTGFG